VSDCKCQIAAYAPVTPRPLTDHVKIKCESSLHMCMHVIVTQSIQHGHHRYVAAGPTIHTKKGNVCLDSAQPQFSGVDAYELTIDNAGRRYYRRLGCVSQLAS
jgi:hypothetical protein